MTSVSKKKAKSDMSKESIISKKPGAASKSSLSKESLTAFANVSQQSKKAQPQHMKTAMSVSGKINKEKDNNNNEYDESMLKVMGKALTHNHWFHGLMPRDEIEYLLKNEGDFLLRKTEVEKKPRYAISVHRKGAIKHILLNYKDGLWYMRDCKKATLTDLINTHVNDKIPVMADGKL
uniref:SH2 domain-containing protein n=1 Tax=Panagrolaimus davidi TaxID=227884 RepID=A0A914Q9U2_9BILA